MIWKKSSLYERNKVKKCSVGQCVGLSSRRHNKRVRKRNDIVKGGEYYKGQNTEDDKLRVLPQRMTKNNRDSSLLDPQGW